MSSLPRTLLPALSSPPGDRLEVVSAWDDVTPYQSWRPQILVPATFRPPTAARVFAVVNQKGGAGKTTTTVELAAAWAAAGFRVRVIDADDQEAALSVWLLPQFPQGAPQRSLRSVFFDECTLLEATYPTLFENIDIVPSGLDLKRVEYDRPIGAEQALATALRKEAEQDGGRSPYDVTLIDGAPSLGLVTVAALTAGDQVLVPLAVGGLDLKAMASLDRTITSVQEKTNPKLDVGAVFLTAWDKSGFARQLAAKVSEDYPDAPVFPIRRSVRAAEAPITERPVRLHAPESTAAGDYGQAADVLMPARAAA
ncbi:ParA family protein [Streptomyces sp. NBC_00847]|uniref:ParA family protein n=1 Tax=Streptomyces sp. NBC_00847 TaxID=2975850 RepID=UPI00225E2F9C|nr:AAA family ATPase [Streptomyces sp. NBC_00847]MCX4886067.1 AAA family ATPase [Streptomyces sp. NBC_00847]